MTTGPADGGEDTDLTASLRALSQTYPELPAAVADRLDRTLAELPELAAPDTAPAPVPAPRPPWWRRRFALASAGLAVVAFLGGGLLFAVQPWQTGSGGDAASADQKQDEQLDKFNGERDGTDKGEAAPEEEPGTQSDAGDYRVYYSGRDYRVTDLGDAVREPASSDKSALPAELEPLATDTALRDDCLAEYTGVYGGSVELVDFAKYEGEPAMIAVLEFESGGGYVAAVAPDCEALEGRMVD